jgi:hypothetical protein
VRHHLLHLFTLFAVRFQNFLHNHKFF